MDALVDLHAQQACRRKAPDALEPEQAEAGEQARAAQVQAGNRFPDAVPVCHYVQAAVIRHVALQKNGLRTFLRYLLPKSASQLAALPMRHASGACRCQKHEFEGCGSVRGAAVPRARLYAARAQVVSAARVQEGGGVEGRRLRVV